MLYVGIVPVPPWMVIVPTGLKSSVTQRTVPSGRATSLTCAVSRLKPPQPLNRVSSASASPLGVRPLSPVPRGSSSGPPPVGNRGGGGGGGSVRVRETGRVAVVPGASVPVGVNVAAPSALGAPGRTPGGRNVRPAG